MNVMILAAGRGERLRPITNEIPKCLVEVRGRSLLERHLKMLSRSGVRRVVINLGWLGEKIVEVAGNGERFNLEIVYSDESDKILETGGGITKALPLLGDEPFWVINGDIFTDFELPINTLKADMLGHLILVPKPVYRSNGDFSLNKGRVIVSHYPKFTFGGIALYDPQVFSDKTVSRFSVVPTINALSKNKKLSGFLYEGIWEDVGTPERLGSLNQTN
tara:strand:+ start:1353 stop:2009 length:657 start_codon:yes stop_codon:yes gene_type:complete